MRVVIVDDREGRRAAARRAFNAAHQRRRLRWRKNPLAHAPAKRRADAKTIFAQETKVVAEALLGVVAEALRERRPKLGALTEASRDDVPANLNFPREHWPRIASTPPASASTARSSAAPTRRAFVGNSVRWTEFSPASLPDDGAILRLVGALMLETDAARAVARRRMGLGTRLRATHIAKVGPPLVAA